MRASDMFGQLGIHHGKQRRRPPLGNIQPGKASVAGVPREHQRYAGLPLRAPSRVVHGDPAPAVTVESHARARAGRPHILCSWGATPWEMPSCTFVRQGRIRQESIFCGTHHAVSSTTPSLGREGGEGGKFLDDVVCDHWASDPGHNTSTQHPGLLTPWPPTMWEHAYYTEVVNSSSTGKSGRSLAGVACGRRRSVFRNNIA